MGGKSWTCGSSGELDVENAMPQCYYRGRTFG